MTQAHPRRCQCGAPARYGSLCFGCLRGLAESLRPTWLSRSRRPARCRLERRDGVTTGYWLTVPIRSPN